MQSINKSDTQSITSLMVPTLSILTSLHFIISCTLCPQQNSDRRAVWLWVFLAQKPWNLWLEHWEQGSRLDQLSSGHPQLEFSASELHLHLRNHVSLSLEIYIMLTGMFCLLFFLVCWPSTWVLPLFIFFIFYFIFCPLSLRWAALMYSGVPHSPPFLVINTYFFTFCKTPQIWLSDFIMGKLSFLVETHLGVLYLPLLV